MNDFYWKVEDSETINFNDIAKDYGNWPWYKFNNMGIMASLRNKKTGQQVIVVNVHLYYNPDYDYVKVAQAVHLLERSAKFYKQNVLPKQ